MLDDAFPVALNDLSRFLLGASDFGLHRAAERVSTMLGAVLDPRFPLPSTRDQARRTYLSPALLPSGLVVLDQQVHDVDLVVLVYPSLELLTVCSFRGHPLAARIGCVEVVG